MPARSAKIKYMGGKLMDFSDLARKRFSVRAYDNKPVEHEKLQAVLEGLAGLGPPFLLQVGEAHEQERLRVGGERAMKLAISGERVVGLALTGVGPCEGGAGREVLERRDHTMSSADWQEVRLNGRSVGEIGLDALVFGCFGVPVVLVSGDDKVCAEARELFGAIETAVVKQGLARHLAITLSPQRSRELVREAARRATEKVGKIKPFTLPGPYEARLKLVGTDLVDGRYFDGQRVTRLDGQTILFRGDDLQEVLSIAR
jgi:D-aminopeptidase